MISNDLALSIASLREQDSVNSDSDAAFRGRLPEEEGLIAHWEKEQAAPFEGWNFASLGSRLKFEPLPWDYGDAARRALLSASRMLDLGTGGGEFLEGLAPLPSLSVATELVPRRAQVARERLLAHGVIVVALDQTAALPFKRDAFDLVLTRNSAFVGRLVGDVLAPGGVFLTQQVGRGNLRALLQELSLSQGNKDWKSPEQAVEELKEAGFSAVEMVSAQTDVEFADVGALLYFLNAILPGRVEVRANYDALKRLQMRLDAGKPLRYPRERYLVTARK